MKDLKISSFSLTAGLLVVGLLIFLYQHKFSSRIPVSFMNEPSDETNLVGEQNDIKRLDSQLAGTGFENFNGSADKESAGAQELNGNQLHSTSRVLSSDELVLHNQATRSHRAKLLSQRYGLPDFSKRHGLSSESEEASLILMTKYSEYFYSQLSTDKLLQLSTDVGFRKPVAKRIRSLRSELLHFEREVKGATSTDVMVNEPNSIAQFTLQKLREPHLIESRAKDLNEGQSRQFRAALQLDAIGSKFCFDLSQFMVKNFLNV